MPEKQDIKELHKTAILRTAHILRKVLMEKYKTFFLFTLQQAMKAQRTSRGIALLFNFGARVQCVVNATTRLFIPGKETR
jgi:hypothetical protein